MRWPIFVLALASLSAACQEPFSNEDLIFLKSVPTSSAVSFQVPGAEAPEPPPDDGSGRVVSAFYLTARNTSRQFNAGISSVLGLIDRITAEPPTERRDDTRIWGPIPDGEVQYLFVINRRTNVGTSTTVGGEVVVLDEVFEFTMVGKRREAADADYRPVFGGYFAPLVSSERGVGALVMDFETAREIDPSRTDRGWFALRYDNRTPGIRLELFLDLPDGMTEPLKSIDGVYRYENDAEGNITFLYASPYDIDDGAPGREAAETLVILARWQADNRGRADVYASGGDLPENFLVSVFECWNEDFRRVYLESSMEIPDLPEEGVVENCAPAHRTPLRLQQ